MSTYLPGLPGPQQMQTVRQELRGGVMSGAYVLHHIIALFVMPAALFVMVFGFGGTLINPANAYTSWDWWRLYGAMFIVFLIPFVEYWLGQERKVAMTGGAGNVSYNRAQINGIFAVYMVLIVVLGAWVSILTVWVGVADFGDCSASAVCSGVSGGGTPCAGAIMIIVGMGVLAISTWVLFLGGLYVHAAARDAYNARLSIYFPLAAQIGASIDGASADASHVERLIGDNVADIGFGLRALFTWPAFFSSEADKPAEVPAEEKKKLACAEVGAAYTL